MAMLDAVIIKSSGRGSSMKRLAYKTPLSSQKTICDSFLLWVIFGEFWEIFKVFYRSPVNNYMKCGMKSFFGEY